MSSSDLHKQGICEIEKSAVRVKVYECSSEGFALAMNEIKNYLKLYEFDLHFHQSGLLKMRDFFFFRVRIHPNVIFLFNFEWRNKIKSILLNLLKLLLTLLRSIFLKNITSFIWSNITILSFWCRTKS